MHQVTLFGSAQSSLKHWPRTLIIALLPEIRYTYSFPPCQVISSELFFARLANHLRHEKSRAGTLGHAPTVKPGRPIKRAGNWLAPISR